MNMDINISVSCDMVYMEYFVFLRSLYASHAI